MEVMKFMNDYISKVVKSKHNAKDSPDPVAKGAFSRWLEDDNIRMRIISYPPGFKADHICYKGHAIYVISGGIKLQMGEAVTEWGEGDAFIIPDDVPHVVVNDSNRDAKVVVVDNI